MCVFYSAHPAQASVLACASPLFKNLFRVCSNGKVPNLKLVSALSSCHANTAIYHHEQEIHSWAPQAGAKIRICAAHFRDMANDEEMQLRCLRKARGLQQIDWATS